jgi:hypothetical protein
MYVNGAISCMVTQRRQVRFNPAGTLGGTVNGKPLTMTIKTQM